MLSPSQSPSSVSPSLPPSQVDQRGPSSYRITSAAILEQHLFLAWRTGDAPAGMRLFQRLRTTLLRFFRTLPPHTAEDLAQETLVACVRARATLRDVRALRRYLYTVARRMRGSEWSRLHTTPVPLDDEHHDDLAYRLGTERLDVERLLDTLPTPLTELVVEYYIDGRRAPEIAQMRRVPLGTVRSQLRRGLYQLRRSAAAPA